MGIEELLLDLARKEGFKIGYEQAVNEMFAQKEIEIDTRYTKNLLTSTDLNTAKIAALVGVSEDFVLRVKKDLKV